MNLAIVVGTAVLSHCVEPYRGKTLHLTQDLNEALEPAGEVQVSASWQPVLEGDLVIVEVAREAANSFGDPQPFDSVILGKVDSIHLETEDRPSPALR